MTDVVEVDVVRADLAEIDDWGALRDALSPDERLRADGYKVQEARDVFTLARGLLRIELASRLGVSPAGIAFDLRPSGKPDLRTPGQGGRDWRFSVSHAGPHTVLAFARGVEVGLDIERADRTVNPLQIATRYFTDREAGALAALPEAELRRAFFAGWTRKEAIVKARGTTMAQSLKVISVDLDPDATEPHFHDGAKSPDQRPCRLAAFTMAPPHLVGALAVLSSDRPQLRFSVRSPTDLRLAFPRL